MLCHFLVISSALFPPVHLSSPILGFPPNVLHRSHQNRASLWKDTLVGCRGKITNFKLFSFHCNRLDGSWSNFVLKRMIFRCCDLFVMFLAFTVSIALVKCLSCYQHLLLLWYDCLDVPCIHGCCYNSPDICGYYGNVPDICGYFGNGPDICGYCDNGPDICGYCGNGPDICGYCDNGPDICGYCDNSPDICSYGCFTNWLLTLGLWEFLWQPWKFTKIHFLVHITSYKTYCILHKFIGQVRY